jgi:hypothetical protein
MGIVVEFPKRAAAECFEDSQIDLMTAVDVAIRDLADVLRNWDTEEARRQARDCRNTLLNAYLLSLAE